ncbi:hypothetical protein NHQ30_006881 [Ciborinia camelliae]|nr:hypothetical protein NHQ30_006881 [Ciborinia camelliae]
MEFNIDMTGKTASESFESIVFKFATQQSTQTADKLAQAQLAIGERLTQIQHQIREQQKQIEDYQIKIHEHVQLLATLRLDEKIISEEQLALELEKVAHALVARGNKSMENEILAKETLHKEMPAKQTLAQGIFYEAEF